jgi:phosphate transport system permease protein
MRARHTRLKLTNWLVQGACGLATAAAIVPLVSVLVGVIGQGLSCINLSFFTELPKPVGESGGGMGNAMVGSLTLVGVASLIAVPVGVLAGIYLAEFGHGRFAKLVRFGADVLSGVPSIVVGIFVYTLLVLSMRGFSALAGAVALAILMLPTVMRSTEELLALVPEDLREAALALGVPRWRTILQVILRTALPGIGTGIMLAVARAAGETAPLLFTALNNRFWSARLDQPIASLPVQIFTYAVSPFPDWHRQAWAAALVLMLLVLILNLATRALARRATRAK